MLDLFKSNDLYKKKFHNIWYICPDSSFSSVKKHPFKDHDKVIHDVTPDVLYDLYNQLEDIKNENIKKPHYNLVIFDDYADILKNNGIVVALNKLLIKARHLCCGFIFTLQSYYYMPKILRKQATYLTIFKCKNMQEWFTIAIEILKYKNDDALILYNYVFDELYNHLDIDTVTNTYYKNFNELVIKN